MDYVTAARRAAVGDRAALWQNRVADPVADRCAAGGEYASLGPSTLTQPAADLDGLESEIAVLRQADLTRIITAAFAQASAALPGPDTTVCVLAAYPAATTITTLMHGVSALTAGAGKIWLTLRPGGDWLDWIPYGVAHEYHHSAWTWRYFQPTRGSDLLSYLVFEGRADSFAHLIYPDVRAPWVHAVSGAALGDAWRLLEPQLHSSSPSLKQAAMFGGGEFRPWTGYTMGYAIVQAYLGRHPNVTITEWTALDPLRLFAESGFQPGRP